MKGWLLHSSAFLCVLCGSAVKAVQYLQALSAM